MNFVYNLHCLINVTTERKKIMSNLLKLIQKKQKQIAEGKNRLSTIRPKDGTNRYRLLPSWKGEGEEFWHDYGAHWVKDAAGGRKGTFTCLKKTHGQRCPVCELMDKLKKGTDETTAKIIDQAYATQRVLVNVLEVHGDKPNEPQILEMAITAFQDLLNMIARDGDIYLRLKGGHDFTITKTGQFRNTSYQVLPCMDATDVDPSVLKKLPNLDTAVQVYGDPTEAMMGLNEIAGILPPPAQPALVNGVVEPERAAPALPVMDASFVSVNPQLAKPAKPELGDVPFDGVDASEVSDSMSDDELAKFIGDL